MYRVVGCRDCGALWIVADRPETTSCPRCGRRHQFDALHAFFESTEEDAARQARASLLAERAGHGDDFDSPDSQLDSVGIDDADFLAGSGLDPDAVAAAAERASAGPATPPAPRETVLAALDELDRPSEAKVVDYATDRDVPADVVAELLERLVQAGEVSESAGRYRRL